MSIRFCNITKRFGDFLALEDINLEIPVGRLLALLGPSGSGKTTLLRLLAGLEMPDAGTIWYRGENITFRPARERQMGFVFQHYALFRHLNVFENIAFPLRIRRWPEVRLRERVQELLHLVRLEGLETRWPHQLSGGQRQRVALARALAAQPQVLLLDEPFGALDAKVRQELRHWLRRLHEQTGVTTLFVTHDQEEAFEVADLLVLLHRGRIEQVGTPQEVFEQPANAFVLDFLGRVNVFPGRLQNGRALLGNLELQYPGYLGSTPQATPIYVRPHEWEVAPTPTGQPGLQAQIRQVHPAGAVVRLHALILDLGILACADLAPDQYAQLRLQAGDLVWLTPRRIHVFTPEYSI
jgi:sulfate transport system ATP-binding protein